VRWCAVFLLAMAAALPAFSAPLKVSQGARQTGLVVLHDLAIRDGRILFRADSNGCTDARSFTVHVTREESSTTGAPRYRLAIERVRSDECKALLLDGVEIEIDLVKDLGLTGRYTISLDNPISARSMGGQ